LGTGTNFDVFFFRPISAKYLITVFREKVQDINDSISREMEFGDVGFCGGRKTVELGENPRSKARTNNELNPHMVPDQNEPGPPWREASALNTAPSLLPK